MLAIERSDGGVTLLHVADGVDAMAALERWKAQNDGQYVRHVENPIIPDTRDSRDRWYLDGDVVRVRDGVA